MKKVFTLLHLVLITIIATTLPTTSAIAQELKIGYVNAARLLEEAPQAEAATAKLKQEFAPREEQIVAAQKRITEQEDKLNRDGSVMSEIQRRNSERDIVASKRELRRTQDEFRDDLNFRRNEEIGKLQQLIKGIIEELGKQGNYDLIMFEGIAFANPRIDLTDKVLEKLRTDGGKSAAPGKTNKPK